MQKTKLIIVGGFLGSGKTTSIIALAKLLLEQGKKVGVVTNDQGSNLVDTKYMQSQGLPVLEVSGGCFCCNLDQFTKKLGEMQQKDYPDYILAEPVGSCINLVATLMKPIRSGYPGQFTLSPLSVVVDPKRLRRVIRDSVASFSNDINYLFCKQLEEADIIVLNKIDTVQEDELAEMRAFLAKQYPTAELMEISAREGDGMADWSERVVSLEDLPHDRAVPVSYQQYTRAEAALGWLNCSAAITVHRAFDGNEFALLLAQWLQGEIKKGGYEIAHLKTYVVSSLDYCKLSCVSVEESCEFDQRMTAMMADATLVLNIRAAAPPQFLKGAAESALALLQQKFPCSIQVVATEAFAPAYARPKKVRVSRKGGEGCGGTGCC